MLSKPVMLALFVASVTAAVGGAFLATRPSTPEPGEGVVAGSAGLTHEGAGPESGAVADPVPATEELIADLPSREPEPIPAPASGSAAPPERVAPRDAIEPGRSTSVPERRATPVSRSASREPVPSRPAPDPEPTRGSPPDLRGEAGNPATVDAEPVARPAETEPGVEEGAGEGQAGPGEGSNEGTRENTEEDDAGGWTGLEQPWPSRERDVATGPDGETIEPLPTPASTQSPSPLPEEPTTLDEGLDELEEFIVSADSVIGLQVENTVTSETARIEDNVEARVTRDVKVGSDVAIPAGSEVFGSITLVETGGKLKERARLGVRFHTIVLADATRLPIRTETVYREGDSPAGKSSAKIGGAAIGGAIIGAIFGGSKGAVLGGSAGAAGGTAAVMAGGRNPAVLQAGSTVTVRLSEPATVTVPGDR